MKFFFYNIAHGIKPNKSFFSQINQLRLINKNFLDMLLKPLREIRPDILALVEIDSGSLRSRKINETKYIASKLDYKFSFYHKYNGTIVAYLPILRKHGSAIIYNRKIDVKTNPFYFNHGFKRVIVKSNFIYKNNKFSLYILHFSVRKKIRKLQFQELTDIIQKDNNKIILVGDFNLFDGEKELKNFISNTGLIIYPNNQPTFPSWNPKIKIDYLITSKNIRIKTFKIENMLLSDHLAFSFEI